MLGLGSIVHNKYYIFQFKVKLQYYVKSKVSKFFVHVSSINRKNSRYNKRM